MRVLFFCLCQKVVDGFIDILYNKGNRFEE